MARQTALLTAEDLLRLPDDESRTELVRGELKKMAPAGGEHGGLAMDLALIVGAFVRNEHLGRTFAAETGFLLQRDPDTVRAPDFAFVRQERLAGGPLPRGYIPFAPDLAVEVISASESAEDVQEKVADYLNAGARLVWLLYPRLKVVVAHTPDGTRTLGTTNVLDGGDTLPGFQMSVAEIFGDEVTSNE
jgi:Uma2 family endonuclease